MTDNPPIRIYVKKIKIIIGSYYKTINRLDNTLNGPSKFRTKKWIEISYDSDGTYNAKYNNANVDNSKLLKQLKSGFKRTINWSKYQSEV